MVKTSLLIYAGHFFSSWGDRMWHFAIPLFLLDLEPTTLTLSAAYGLTLACTVLLFGPLVGDWIDHKPRLYCAKISLIIQNSAVVLCAALLLVNRKYGDKTSSYVIGVKIGAIALGAIGQLASIATGIIIQKDWVVVVARGKENMLANLNSMMRRIDLATKILAPLACGQIMALAELTGGAIFIVCWNAISMVVEYVLLKAVYDRTPALASKTSEMNVEDNADEMVEMVEMEQDQKEKDKTEEPSKNKPRANKKKKSTFQKMFGFILTVKDGWKLYMAQPIALPCIGFSFLYMTILGFGYITTSYAYNQCFSELMVGILLAGTAVTGIVATFMFPVMRKKLGLIRTGLFNAAFQIVTLIPCIASVFVAGSPFYLLPENRAAYILETTTSHIATTPSSNISIFLTSNSSAVYTQSNNITTVYVEPDTEDGSVSSNLFFKCLEGVDPPSSYLSLSLLMTGIIVARIGLWGFDLTITQLIQENVVETERGIFNGVQTSLNNLMDLLRFLLVLMLPNPSQFGILVMLSATFVTTGYILYMFYARKMRGHLLPHCSKTPVLASEPSA